MFRGHVSDEEKSALYRGAIGFISPQVEDFGITIVGSHGRWTSGITFGQGGGTETVIPEITGIHLETQSWEEIGDAIIRFDPSRFDPHDPRSCGNIFNRGFHRRSVIS